jgi:hypothetical protein
MEETKPEEELLPFVGFLALLEFLGVLGQETSHEVVLHSSRRFVSHLDSSHENGHWKHIGWHGRQPHPEIA